MLEKTNKKKRGLNGEVGGCTTETAITVITKAGIGEGEEVAAIYCFQVCNFDAL